MSTGQGGPLGRGKDQQEAGTRCAGCGLGGRKSRLRCPGCVCLPALPPPCAGGSVPPLLDPILTTGPFPRHARALGTERTEQDPTLLLPSVCVCVCLCGQEGKNLGLREEETKFEFRKTRKNKLPLVISGSLLDAQQ